MERSGMIRLCIKKSIFVFFFLFLFYCLQSCGVFLFPVGRCLGNALFVTSALMLADGFGLLGEVPAVGFVPDCDGL